MNGRYQSIKVTDRLAVPTGSSCRPMGPVGWQVPRVCFFGRDSGPRDFVVGEGWQKPCRPRRKITPEGCRSSPQPGPFQTYETAEASPGRPRILRSERSAFLGSESAGLMDCLSSGRHLSGLSPTGKRATADTRITFSRLSRGLAPLLRRKHPHSGWVRLGAFPAAGKNQPTTIRQRA